MIIFFSRQHGNANTVRTVLTHFASCVQAFAEATASSVGKGTGKGKAKAVTKGATVGYPVRCESAAIGLACTFCRPALHHDMLTTCRLHLA